MSKHSKRNIKINKFVLIFRIVSVGIILVCLYFILNWYKENNHTSLLKDELISDVDFENKVVTTNNKETIDFSKLLSKNSDVIGWVIVNNTDINYSVVQSDNNSYYLTHSFDKLYNSAGWIFADYRNKLDGTDKNIVIYGHNRKDRSMFGSLENILEKEWYSNSDNCTITLYTENETQYYQVFSVYEILASNNENKIVFDSNEEYKDFLETIRSKSIYDFNVDLSNTNNILTLSTCGNNNKYRVLLHAKRIC